jgi:hypothetical protein
LNIPTDGQEEECAASLDGEGHRNLVVGVAEKPETSFTSDGHGMRFCFAILMMKAANVRHEAGRQGGAAPLIRRHHQHNDSETLLPGLIDRAKFHNTLLGFAHHLHDFELQEIRDARDELPGTRPVARCVIHLISSCAPRPDAVRTSLQHWLRFE